MIDSQIATPRDDELIEDLAKAWIAFYQPPDDPEGRSALVWASDRMSYLVEYLPDKAWKAVLSIWSLDQSLRTRQILSAGPIEDLLAKHGDRMIERVEAEAKRDPSFAHLLGGVWQNSMTDEVWARLQAVWDRRGWDGIPE